MAAKWIEGFAPYTAVWDHKPVGIYFIFLCFIKVFGLAIHSIRIATIFFVFLSALLTQKIGEKMFDRQTGIYASLVYAVFSLGLEGLAANTEHFFIFFNLLGVYAALTIKKASSAWRFIIIGIAWGIAFQIKYSAGFEILFYILFFSFYFYRWLNMPFSLTHILGGLAGFLLPTFLVILYFYMSGYWGTFYASTLLANIAHLSPTFDYKTVVFFYLCSVGRWFVHIYPMVLIGTIGYIISSRRTEPTSATNPIPLILFGWVLVTLVEAWTTLRFSEYYYLPTIAPVCITFAHYFNGLFKDTHKLKTNMVLIMVMLLPLSKIGYKTYWPWTKFYLKNRSDQTEMISKFIKSEISPNDTIYVADDEPIIYFLAGAQMPTRYIFPPFLTEPHFIKVAGVTFQNEMKSILKLKPKFVVLRATQEPSSKPQINFLLQQMEGVYRLDRQFENTDLYRLK